ncbi:hypothetical protein AURDEDRAFT_148985 [Auricularia subglabra TFB-10046 SS5]|nr:hypothetical protein AURDEDRAFT_148985 [Auricularia subglabra TFB-10046 SS5]
MDDSPSAGRGTGKSSRLREPSPQSSPTDKRKRSHRDTENEDTAVETFPEPDVDGEEEQDQDQEEQPPPKKKQRKSPPPKKFKAKPVAPAKVRRPVTVGAENEVPGSRSNNGLIVRQRLQDATNTSDDDGDARGLRRSKRVRYSPLEWWRLEKVVYGRRQSGAGSVVPVIKEIIRRPKPEDEPLTAKHRRRRGSKPPSSRGKGKAIEREPTPEDEQGLDDETDPNGEVRDYVTGELVQRRVAFTAAMVNPKPAEKNDFLFQKIFGDGDFIAAGQLVIPPGKKKPVKPSRDNSYVFYLIEGAVRFQVHQSEFVLTTGGMFMAPRGNYYLIKNVASRPAKVFFAQARKVAPEQNVAPAITTPRRQSGTPGGAPSSDARAILPTSKSKAG